MTAMPALIGTSGWQYRHWDGSFYPAQLAKSAQLRYYADLFQVVEVNFTFYRLPEASAFRNWAEQSPDDFIFIVKASRFLTHMKKLKDPEEPVERLMSRARELGPKLGGVLIQLPPNMHRNEERLDAVLALLAPETRVAVEFRHDSWYTDSVREVLERHSAALCLADRGNHRLTPDWRTAPWGYLRFHGGLSSPPGCYDRARLEEWAGLAGSLWQPDEDVYVFFNNDFHRCALRDAGWFAEASARFGFAATRVPAPESIRVG